MMSRMSITNLKCGGNKNATYALSKSLVCHQDCEQFISRIADGALDLALSFYLGLSNLSLV